MNDSFYYGRRQVIKYDRTGQPSYTYLPLTADDFLNPQLGDEFVQGARHAADVRNAKLIFRYLYRYNPFMTVLSNVKLVWEIDKLAQPMPDLVVIPNMTEPERPRTVFDVQLEETRPRFVLEVVAPRLAEADLKAKVAIYQQAGVLEYFIIDAGLRAEQEEQENPVYTVIGYRLEEEQYAPIAPDARGWLYSKINKVWLGATLGRDTFIVVDGRTGQPIMPDAAYDDPPAAAHAEATSRAQSIAAQLDLLRP